MSRTPSVDFSDSLHIRSCIKELLQITGQEEHMSVDSLVRLLRPATHDMREFTNALKQKIRQTIVVRPGGPMVMVKFEKACDQLKKVEGKQQKLLPSFLAIFSPLVYSPVRCSPIIETAREVRHEQILAAAVSLPTSATTTVPSASISTSTSMALAVETSKTQPPVDLAQQRPPLKPADVPDLVLPPNPMAAVPALQYDEGPEEEEAVLLVKHREALDALWLSPEVEIKVIRDLLYVFQGIGGRHIKYDARSEAYVIDPSLPLKSLLKDVVLSLCELGWLYGKVDAYVKRAEADKFRGLVMHALGFALQEELHDYYRLLAVLEQELGRKVKQQQAREGAAAGSTVSVSGLTLLRLRAWVQEPQERLFLMARLVESAAPLQGGALASRIYGHSKHGDPMVRTFSLRLLGSVCAPLYTMITRWLLHGELQDAHHEFFVSSTAPASSTMSAMLVQNENAWHNLFFLNHAMLPSFLTVDLASRILVVGKSISFLRVCVQSLSKAGSEGDSGRGSKARGLKLGRESVASALRGTSTATTIGGAGSVLSESADTAHLMTELFARGDELAAALSGLLDQGGHQRLHALVDSISGSVDAKLLNLMESRYYLSTHLESLKKFMLLGQGDFVTCLMDALGPELKRKATLLYRHNLTGMLEGALRASNAQFEPSYVLERVGVRLLEASPGDSGWEVFSLDYFVDPPLSAVVHADAMARYRTAFHALWRLKRLEWSLSSAWKQLMAFNHVRGATAVPRLKAVLHHCSLSRAVMTHVVNNFCAFMQFEVIESAWGVFQSVMSSATCLDAVVTAHDAYLAQIHKRALLDVQHESFNVQVQLMLQSMLRFCALEESLVADAIAAIARRRALLSDIKAKNASSLKGKGGSGGGRVRGKSGQLLGSYDEEEGGGGADGEEELAAELATPVKSEGMTGYLIERLDEAVKDFTMNFERIMTLLKDQGDKAEELSRFLTFRLDYNDYYSGHAAERTNGNNSSSINNANIGSSFKGREATATAILARRSLMIPSSTR